MSKLRIFGDSHVSVLARGWTSAKSNFASLPFSVEFYARHGVNWMEFETSESDGGLRFHADRLADHEPVDYVAASFDDVHVFSSPLHSGPTYQAPVWQKFCPWGCVAANPGRHGLSTTVMETWIGAKLQCRLTMLRAMKTQGYKIMVVEPPKPLLRAAAQNQISSDILVAADRAHRDFVVRQVNESLIPVIAVPAHTHSEGFTIAEYAALAERDLHHGNWMFGAEMMANIVAAASRDF